MLSFIYRMAREYERSCGQKPNLLYLNRFHFEHMREQFADPEDIEAMMKVLDLTIMISEDAINPHLTRIVRPAMPRLEATPRSGIGRNGDHI